MYVIE